MPVNANLVHQQSTTTGASDLTVSAVNGKQSFDTAFGHGATTNVFDYFISNQGAAEWEYGTGHMSTSSNLVRDTVINSSTGSAVSFTAGTKDVVNDAPFTRQKNNIHGADIASATTTNLDTATGDLVDVTGTTTITGITLAEGQERTVRFTGALTLTNGASLLLPGAANITTAAGDFAKFRGYASSVVRCVSYTKLDGTAVVAPAVAAQSDMETATSTTLMVTPGRQYFHPAHPKAFYYATVTPTAVTGAATSETANVFLWNTAHGLTTGDTIIPVTLPPTGVTNLSPYYVNVVDTTHFSLHLTLANALAGTSKVTISSSTAMTMRKLVYSTVLSYNMPTTSPVSGVAASTNLSLVFNLSITLSSAIAVAQASCNGVVNSAAAQELWAMGCPSSITTTNITFGPFSFVTNSDLTGVGTWSQQGTTAFTVGLVLWGDI